MRRVNRSSEPIPASLRPGGRGEAELTSARAYYGSVPSPRKAFKFKVYKAVDIERALRRLFHGKCAYCEGFFAATQPADIEHYRPKGGIEESAAHPGYWWLAMRWDNLLPSCIDCNRRRTHLVVTPGMTVQEAEAALESAPGSLAGKENSFPTRNHFWSFPEDDPIGIEQALLIDPTRTDPERHISWDLEGDLPIAVPREASQEGEASIRVFALNRFSLVQARHRRLIELRVVAELIESMLDILDDLNEELQAKQIVKIVEHAKKLDQLAADASPFTAMARGFVLKFREKLQAELEQYSAVLA